MCLRLCSVLALATTLASPPEPSAAELRARRARVREAMRSASGPEAMLLLRAPAPDRFAGDVDYPYRPDNNLYYLTALARPGVALLLAASDFKDRGREVLFYSPPHEHLEAWLGKGLTAAEVSARSGIPRGSVVPLAELGKELRSFAPQRSFHGSSLASGDRLPFFFETGRPFGAGEGISPPYAYLMQVFGARAFHLGLEPPDKVILPLRQVKSRTELAALEMAIDVTVEALGRAMRAVRPGVFEYEIRAVIEGTFVERGCRGWSFPPIVASGPNTCVLHYEGADRALRDGELLLMDVGAECGFYAADVTRTVPVSGRFSAEQRQLYDVVLHAQEAAIAAVRPGATLAAVHATAQTELAAGLRAIGRLGADEEIGRYFPHRASHGLGLDVHDPMPDKTLAPGMVITVEPGLYFPALGIGLRLEDDVRVTASGGEVLSGRLPKTVDALERWMAGER